MSAAFVCDECGRNISGEPAAGLRQRMVPMPNSEFLTYEVAAELTLVPQAQHPVAKAARARDDKATAPQLCRACLSVYAVAGLWKVILDMASAIRSLQLNATEAADDLHAASEKLRPDAEVTDEKLAGAIGNAAVAVHAAMWVDHWRRRKAHDGVAIPDRLLSALARIAEERSWRSSE